MAAAGVTTSPRLELENAFAPVVVSNANRVGYVVDKELAVSNLSSSRGASDSPDHVVRSRGGHDQFDLYFG